ncbi:MAG: HNH endonuclease, partial [Rhizomicrobium sp.]
FRYHFPRTYLRQAEAAKGDWIVYYEPRRPSGDLSSRGGRQAYFATARLDSIQPDATRADHFYGFVSNYLEFDDPVPFREGVHYYETGLQRDDGGTNKGLFGRSVRRISDADFDQILNRGFAQILKSKPNNEDAREISEEPAIFNRPMVERVVARPFRDAAFATAVKAAYENTCAITGLRIINGGGRAEVQAAHIRPVADSGTDSVRNGLALSGTVHWMFDRGLLSVDDDYSLLIAKGRVPDTIERLLNPNGKLRLPEIRKELSPHPQFLRYHRETIFKG